jgi:hypothetical protein
LQPASKSATDFPSGDFPLLLESCSFPRDSARIAALAAEVRSYNSLLRLAEKHGVVAHLAAALAAVSETVIPIPLSDALRERLRLQSLFTLAMSAELFRILELLRGAGLECVVVKGPVLSLRAYGNPAARRYADLDLLVRHADIPHAMGILVAAGYESRVPVQAIRAGKIPGEYFFRRPETNIIFELHSERTFRYFPLPLPIERYFKHQAVLLIDGHTVPSLSLEDEIVLLCVHGAKHFWERLIWVSDVAAMVHNHPELDWKLIRKSAAEVGGARMLRVALLLCDRLLRVRVPSKMQADDGNDPACSRLVAQIESWLPYAGDATPPVAQRALFRFLIGGSAFAGARYLVRLSFSTTEEDWSREQVAGPVSQLAEVLRRPFRLARKYRRPES